VPGFSLDAVAEYAVAMAIEVSRRLPMVVKNKWKANFDISKPVLLKDKIAGIIGLGRIGKRMAEICQGIGMKVIYWSRNSKDNRFKKVKLDELFKTSDVIMPALVESIETKKLIAKKQFDSMKKSAVLVGINRVKAIWDENYILEKVKKGEIAGYAMEGDNAKEPSTYEGNVWAVPPIAWYTQESLDNLMKIWVDNMIAFAKGKPQNVVN
jgi:lactate dehydrogenase-like 2-hydroxyacid dehydrogenase